MSNCNACVYLCREKLEDVHDGAFKACCEIFFLRTSVSIKPRTVSFRAYNNVIIQSPEWCPLKAENKNKPKVYDITKVMENNTSGRTKPTTVPSTVKKVEEKDEKVDVPRRVAWESIKEGVNYVIPRIDLKPCKVMKVVSKTESIVRMKEVEPDGSLSVVVNVVYVDDMEAKLMVPHKTF